MDDLVELKVHGPQLFVLVEEESVFGRVFVLLPHQSQKLLHPATPLVSRVHEVAVAADGGLPPNDPLVGQPFGAREALLHCVVVLHRQLLQEGLVLLVEPFGVSLQHVHLLEWHFLHALFLRETGLGDGGFAIGLAASLLADELDDEVDQLLIPFRQVLL